MSQFHSANRDDTGYADTRNSGIGYIPEDRIATVLYNAYREGRLRRTQSTDNWKAKWQDRLKQQSHCSVQDQFFLTRCIQFAEKARASANAGEIGASCQLFGLARALGASRELSDEGRLRCQVELAAAEAYLEYYCGDFEQANKKLLDSMLAAQELEELYGYTVLHIHRIHLLNNMVKVEARANRLREAMALATHIILYLQEKTETLPVPASWGRSYSQGMTVEDRRFLSAQLIGELAAATVGRNPATLRGAFKILVMSVNMDEQHPSWHPEGHEWLQLKALNVMELNVMENDVPIYLKRCLPYVAHGPGTSVLLWHLAALDMASACESVDSGQAHLFQRTVLADLQQLKGVPRHIRVLVDRMLADLTKVGPVEIEKDEIEQECGRS